jgi:hypothetical protein
LHTHHQIAKSNQQSIHSYIFEADENDEDDFLGKKSRNDGFSQQQNDASSSSSFIRSCNYAHISLIEKLLTNKQTNKQTNRQTDRQTDRQTKAPTI